MTKPLWDHQKETINFARDREAALDFSDPGTGKTRAWITVAHERLEAGEIDTCLMMAPRTLLDTAWGEDFDEYFPDTPYSVAYASNRAEAFNAKVPFFITNNDAIKWLMKQPKSFFKRFGRLMLVIDESTDFKHITSTRTKMMTRFAEQKFVKYATCMTATPKSKSVTEMWAQAYIVDNGERLGKNFYGFRNQLCTPVQRGASRHAVDWVDKERAEEIVYALLADITIRHEFEKCMDIPPNHQRVVRFEPSQKLLKAYFEMEATARIMIQKGEVRAVNAAVMIGKLLQIASGAVYSSDDPNDYVVLDDTRYHLIADLVERRKHSIVFYSWNHQRDELVHILKKRGIEHAVMDSSVSDKRRKALRQEYQAGNFQTLLLHPNTGAHGLTLTRGTADIWASPVYRADFLKQGKHRIYRGGQTKRTYSERVVARGTHDEAVLAKSSDRLSSMQLLLDMFKE